MINQDYWEYFPDVINGDSKWCFCCDLQNLCPTHSHCTGPNVTVKSMQVIFKVPNRDEIVMQICSPLFSRRVRVKTGRSPKKHHYVSQKNPFGCRLCIPKRLPRQKTLKTSGGVFWEIFSDHQNPTLRRRELRILRVYIP